MKHKFTNALSLALIMAMFFTSVGLADQVGADNDIVTPGNQSSVDLTVAPDALVSTNTQLAVDFSGSRHLIAGSSLVLQVATNNLPVGYAVSEVSTTVPDPWNATVNIFAAGNSNISFTAPSLEGVYVYNVKWDDKTKLCSSGDCVSSGNAFTINLTVEAPPNTEPVLSVPSNILAEATSGAGAVVSYSATASDTEDGALIPTCSPASGSTFPLGATTVNCSVSDSGGMSDSASFSVTVQDTTAPALTLPASASAEATGASGAIVTYAASATDLVDGNVTVNCAPASGSTFALGSTTVSCSATDAHNNTANGSFSVIVADTTAPVLVLPLDITAEATGPSGAAVSYSASASDVVDGAVTPTCSPLSGSTFPLGTTSVDCSATDAHSNTANGSFDVTVEDTTAPTIDAHGNESEEATGPDGAVVNYTSPATHDLVDGDGVATCLPASGDTFPLGTTTVNCSATDEAGNTENSSFEVAVVDTTAPSVTVPSNIIAEATGPSGAAVGYSPATATDLVDGAVDTTCAPASGSTFAIATTTVNCSATDAAGNTGTGSFTVKVQDTTAPVLTLPNNIAVSATSAAGALVTFSASANDIVDGAVTVSCTPASGSNFGPGTTTVNCSATDAHSNTANGSFTVSVSFQLDGFFAPVDMGGVYNVVKGGSTVPLKFEVFAGSTELTLTSVVQSFVVTRIACDGSATFDDIELVTTGATSLRYDATGGQFIQNWQTPRSAGLCYRVTMTTDDGSSISANFKLK